MTDTTNSSTNVEVGTTTETLTTEQLKEAGTTQEVVPKNDYLSLQAESTRWRQGEIEMATKLVQANPAELHAIKDKKVRDAVVKSTSIYSSYDEMVAVEGKETNNSSEEDEVTSLKKQVKQLSYQSEKREIENAINAVKQANPSLFASPENEEKLRNSISLFSNQLEISERVSLAMKVALPQVTLDSTTLAYKALQTSQVSSQGSP